MIHLAPPSQDVEVLDELTRIVGEEHVSISNIDRINYARDMCPISLVHAPEGDIRFPPDVIVWPANVEEVSQICKLAYRTGTPLIPFGAGSGVCGGIFAIKGGIIVDMKRMNKVIEIDHESNLVTAEAGIMGEHLERYLAHRGYTMGHFPSSIYSSTLGGYLAARSAGQFSGKYGKIEDMVVSLQVVLPQGDIVETITAPRTATGPDWGQAIVGSEGTLGFITKATCRLWPAPQSRRFLAFVFPDVKAGTECMRLLYRHGLHPAGVRLYDELDTALVGTSGKTGAGGSPMDFLPISQMGTLIQGLMPKTIRRTKRFFAKKADLLNKVEKYARQGCLLVLVFEGEERIVDYEFEAATTIAESLEGENKGPELAINWYKNRYHVSYKQSKVYYHGAFVDTIEVATTWDKLIRLYDELRAAVSEHAFIMAHFSHAYPDGCSIYFTFVTAADTPTDAERLHRQVWDSAMRAVFKIGGTVSHHHGIGLSKARFMAREHEGAMGIYQAIKDFVDPKNLCNPGKMGLKT